MVEPQPSKLAMRVRFPSPAPPRNRRSNSLSYMSAMKRAEHGTSDGPHTGHKSRGSRVSGPVAAVGLCLAGEPAECFGDHLITVSGGVLVDHGRADAGVPETGHQFLDRCAGYSTGKCPTCVSQVVEVQLRRACCRACGVPDRAEVRSAQGCTLGTNEDQAPLSRLCESV